MLSRTSRLVFLTYSLICYTVYAKSVGSSNITRVNWEGKIVGGVDASIESYPFAVKFINKGAMCGGVIYNSWTVITSGHCLEFNTDINEMVVQAGSRYILDVKAKVYKVKAVVIHEDYSKAQIFACDIALLFLEEHFHLGKLEKKAVIVNHDNWMKDNAGKFTVTGWGWTKYDGEVSPGLMKASLQYVPAKECSKLHKNYLLTSDMFCLYGDGKRDTCRGDSGGGVLWNDQVVGITSHGDGCANPNSPSVYTNLWILRGWIEKRVQEFINIYCG